VIPRNRPSSIRCRKLLTSWQLIHLKAKLVVLSYETYLLSHFTDDVMWCDTRLNWRTSKFKKWTASCTTTAASRTMRTATRFVVTLSHALLLLVSWRIVLN